MRRVRYYLGGALFWGAFLAVCVLLFWNAQRLARAAGGISLRYGEALEPRVVASALEYARDGRNNAAWRVSVQNYTWNHHGKGVWLCGDCGASSSPL